MKKIWEDGSFEHPVSRAARAVRCRLDECLVQPSAICFATPNVHPRLFALGWDSVMVDASIAEAVAIGTFIIASMTNVLSINS